MTIWTCGIWFGLLDHRDVFCLADHEFRQYLKALSDFLKKIETIKHRRTTSLWIENQNHFSALQPPAEGWDPVEQTKQLAGFQPTIHGLISSADLFGDEFFELVARDCLLKLAPPFKSPDDIEGFHRGRRLGEI